MLCYRGCGLISQYTNYKGLGCCDKSANRCPAVAKKKSLAQKGISKPSVSEALTGRKLTQEHKDNVSKALTGRPVSEATIEKIRASNIATKSKQTITPWNKGKKGSQTAWNKGKRKEESLDIIMREDPAYADFKKYRNRVSVRTKQTYETHKEELNPLNLPLGKAGISGAYQIDHIVSVRIGFEQGMLVEEISAKENLQVIPWLDNIKKYDGKNLRKTT